MASKFKQNPRAISELLRTRELESLLGGLASDAAQNARSIAPADDTAPHYRDQIEAQSGKHGDRVIGRVNANKDNSGYIEFGTEDTPTFAPLRRGLEMLGLRVRR